MRHSFSFPKEIRDIVKSHINKAIADTDSKRYSQESPYIAALLAKMEGIIYDGEDYYIKMIATIMNDRGKNSAEYRSGADFAITAKISDGKKTIEKAILVQAKMNIKDLKSSGLKEQIKKMKKVTRSPKVMILNSDTNKRKPFFCSGTKILENKEYKKEEMADYFTRRVMTTFDGDTRKEFIEDVQDSALPNIHLIIKEK